MVMHHHSSPKVVYEKVRKLIPSIPLATVYDTIKTFGTGLLRELSLHHGSARFETNIDPRHHIVFSQCKAIVDLDDGDLEPVRVKEKLPRRFFVQRYSVEIIGV